MSPHNAKFPVRIAHRCESRPWAVLHEPGAVNPVSGSEVHCDAGAWYSFRASKNPVHSLVVLLSTGPLYEQHLSIIYPT